MTAEQRTYLRAEIDRKRREREIGRRGPRLGSRRPDAAADLAASLTLGEKPRKRNRWLPGPRRIYSCIFCGAATYKSRACPSHRDLLALDRELLPVDPNRKEAAARLTSVSAATSERRTA